MGNVCKFINENTLESSNIISSTEPQQPIKQICQTPELKIFSEMYKIERQEIISQQQHSQHKNVKKEHNKIDQFKSDSSPNVLTRDYKHQFANLDLIEPNQFITPTKFRNGRKLSKKKSIFSVQHQQCHNDGTGSDDISIVMQSSEQKKPLKPSIKSLSNYSRMNSPNPSQKSVRWELGSDQNLFLGQKQQSFQKW